MRYGLWRLSHIINHVSGKPNGDFDELLHETEQEAIVEGPRALAELRALDFKFWLLNALIERRRELRLTQKDLADRSGVGQAEISKIERGTRSPTIDTVSKLAAALKLEFPPREKRRGAPPRKGSVRQLKIVAR